MKIFAGSNNALDVEPTDRISSLKEKINQALSIPPDRQTLMFAGKELKDDETLSLLSIHNQSTIHLVIHFIGTAYISINSPSGKIDLPATLTETIDQIKQKLQSIYGYPFKHQYLIYSGRELSGNKSLGFYEIPQEGVISLVILNKEKIRKMLKKLYK